MREALSRRCISEEFSTRAKAAKNVRVVITRGEDDYDMQTNEAGKGGNRLLHPYCKQAQESHRQPEMGVCDRKRYQTVKLMSLLPEFPSATYFKSTEDKGTESQKGTLKKSPGPFHPRRIY